MVDWPRLRVVVGEDQPIVRAGIARVLGKAGHEVVGIAADAEDLVRAARLHNPDVVVTDIQMPPTWSDDGLRAAKEIRAKQPGVGILVLSQFLESRYALDLLADGAEGVGYLISAPPPAGRRGGRRSAAGAEPSPVARGPG